MTIAFLELALKASLIVAAAWIANAFLPRRHSAALRHLVWTLAVVALLVLPLLSASLPRWSVPVRIATSAPTGTGRAERQASTTERRAASGSSEALASAVPSSAAPVPAGGATEGLWAAGVITAVYAAGVCLLLGRLLAGRWRTRGVIRRACEIRDGRWTDLLRDAAERIGARVTVPLLRTREYAMPMALGAWRTAILLPVAADTWDDHRRRSVLVHELAHVARRDCLTQALADVVCALYWPHPGVWWMARRLRAERELACDDRVITAGAQPHDYAGDLLELAYALGGSRPPALAVSMAPQHDLERRMVAVLDRTRSRSPLDASQQILGWTLGLALMFPLAALSVRAAPAAVDESGPGMALDQADSTTPPAESHPGTWEIRSAENGRVHLRLSENIHSSHGSTVPLNRFDGLQPDILSGSGPARFRMRRDAGTFEFDGIFRSGVGTGTYFFAPDAKFSAALVRRGMTLPRAAEQYALARSDMGYEFLDELARQRYSRPDTSDLVKASDHGVTADYLHEMGQLGYAFGTIDTLVQQRDHGVSPAFVRGLRAEGVSGLSAANLVRARDHGVEPEYVSRLKALGYDALTVDGLVHARDHGVSAEYVGEMRDCGYRLTLEDLARARDHGVAASYIRDLESVGYDHLSLDQLVALRDHGVTAEGIRRGNDRMRTEADRIRTGDDGSKPQRTVRSLHEHSWMNDIHAAWHDLIAWLSR